ncbi:DUF2721 domain-containing protein [Iocasia frigidifontis]|uniref:DUF2721 domain-containing protein n=1 Tax=Iocasia fonsfrigidae TaxID=2682810 RepID=A0A8A7KMM5_9FIRM|nr:DUF2721 domain-containing protein [Iocasia fonsfrigidae]MTI59619.1 DUF2721 domain-containing protein [Bacillota bacterium]QTL99092.1 DUF2721 domain-containing protein [Iocasia fonsfrigidae]
MGFTLTTPALVFSTISLLMLAYTNRFSAIASLIRSLHDEIEEKGKDNIVISSQIKSLKRRVKLIRNMQFLAIIALFFCVFSMFLLFFEKSLAGEIVFAVALVLLMISLIISAIEINMSVHALNIQLGEKDIS